MNTLPIVTESEAAECEILMETRMALYNLLCIIHKNDDIKQTFSFNDTKQKEIRSKLDSAEESYNVWWDKIRRKYAIEADQRILSLDLHTRQVIQISCKKTGE